eukprot:TRINITY_DN26643_c0_g4_i2.p1 TRINITY_DN26643_c0_g4~~TRINITY_DN26643_c0_g4_i2.p1  ORF type:complete len:923 (+),score=120.31 TRINITY_DN26643_c0_g4_i2:73-2769(+)
MAGLFGLFGGPGEKVGAKPMFSIEHLQHLFVRLQHFKDSDEQNRDAMVEVIRQITEALIWGEKHDHNLFDFFCEKNMLAHFVHILDRPTAARIVKVQLLQTLSMLVQNIRRDTSLYYLFSNNYVNQLISTQFDWNDEEILGYFISFLKSLAMRLNAETVKFFFNERAEQFPLYIEAVRFFGHHDVMVRAAVRTLTLQVYGIDDLAMRKFVLETSNCTYFMHLACYLRELWYRLDRVSRTVVAGGEQSMPHSLKEVHEEQQDLLMYLSDVMEVEVPSLGPALAERILHHAVFPVVLGSLLADSASVGSSVVGGSTPHGRSSGPSAQEGDSSTSSSHLLSPTCALFVLRQVLDTFRSRVLLEPLVAALLGEPLDENVRRICMAAPLPPPSTYKGSFLADGASTWAPAESAARGRRASSIGDAEDDGQSTSTCRISETVVRDEAPTAASSSCSVLAQLYSYLSFAQGPDVCALLVSGVLRLCLRRRDVLPDELLLKARLLPQSTIANISPLYSSEVKRDLDQSDSAIRVVDGHPLEALLRAAQALKHHTSLRVIVIQALTAFIIDVSNEMSGLNADAMDPIHRAVQAAARQVRSHLHGTLGDSFLDVFAEEWEIHQSATSNTLEACGNVRCLLPAPVGGPSPNGSPVPVEWIFPAAHSERQHAAKATRCLLIIHALHSRFCQGNLALDQKSPRLQRSKSPEPLDDMSYPLSPKEVGQVDVAKETMVDSANADGHPLHIAGEVLDGYMEGRSFQLGRQDRIVCGVVTSEGRHTRYLVLHRFLLLLVQPDLVSPGWAAVRTLAPLKQVECEVDKNDQRMLRLVGRLKKGASCPGEASVYDSSNSEFGVRVPLEERTGSFFTLSLSFEDVKRCAAADKHVQNQRAEVREQLRLQIERYVDGLCD